MEQYGQYELLARLGTGGMAHVFLARRAGARDFARLLVVKRILPHLAENTEFVSMFLQEARVSTRLHHPCISQVLDLGKVGDTFFMAMEYVAGEDLRKVARYAKAEGRPLTVPLACRVIISACEGLDYAHSKADDHGRPLGIVHRDVSPQNLLVGFSGQVKVIDFGIAKAADSANHTRTGVLKGKYAYMSPEQAEGAPLDRRSDVFALGIVLYELVTGSRLFKRANDLATLKAVTECRVPRPSSLEPALDPQLEGIILRALAKNRDERTPTAAQLARELEDYLTALQHDGSVADLRRYLQELYAERLAAEKAFGYPLCIDTDPVEAPGETWSLPPSDRPPPPEPSPPAPSQPKVSRELELAPMPVRVNRLSTPPLSPAVAHGEVSDLSQVSRRARTRKTLLVTLTLVFLALAGAGSALLLSPHTAGRAGRLAVLELRSEPAGARVFIDDKDTGHTTPAELSLEPGQPHAVRLELDGHAPLALSLPAFHTSLAREVKLEKQLVAALHVESTPPGASVIINGRSVAGATPLVVSALPTGTPHELALSLDGYELDVSRVTLEPDRVNTITRRLKRSANASRPATNAAPQQASAVGRKGTLNVTTTPAGIAVHLAGKKVGVTPLELSLPPGRHEVRFLKPQWRLDLKATVTITSGGTHKLERDLTPRTVRFNVTPSANVYLGDELVATSPGDKELAPGTYRFTYSNPELNARHTEVVEVTPGVEPQKVRYRLTEGLGSPSP